MSDNVSAGKKLVGDVLEPMKKVFIGKDEIVDLMGVCLVAGENLFLLGPPGTAKSALVHELGRRLEGKTFEYLLTRFTEPNELFGPFDIRKLREGELSTNTEGMMPEADFVFLDELLNANSAILNSLLTALNERMFRRGRETRPLPVMMVVGASNRLPEDDALGALFDRFLMRVRCDNVPGERLGEVLESGWKLDLQIGMDCASVGVGEIRRLHALLPKVDLSAVRAAHIDLVTRLRKAGISISDRRAVKLQRLVAASAILCGRQKAVVSDLWVFRHIWDTEEQREVLAAQVAEAIGKAGEEPEAHPRARGGAAPDPEALARDLEAVEKRLSDAQLAASDRAAARDRLAALAARVQWVGDASARGFLGEKVDALWAKAGQS